MNQIEMTKMNAAAYIQQAHVSIMAAEDQRPEGHYTSRARQLAEASERAVNRLARVLLNVRGNPPPMPVESCPGSARSVSSMDDHLCRQESAHHSIDQMLGELEGLL